MNNPDMIRWIENGRQRHARWRSENGSPPPARIAVVDDRLSADAALRLAQNGTATLWRGDFHQAIQLLNALRTRLDRNADDRRHARGPILPGDATDHRAAQHIQPNETRDSGPQPPTYLLGGLPFAADSEARTEMPAEADDVGSVAASSSAAMALAYRKYRNARTRRALLLGMLLVELDPGHRLALRRAPDFSAACHEAYGPGTESALVSLSELRGVASASEWRRRGVHVPALDARIHPHYGVFAPGRGEYVDLVARAPLPSRELAFDIGTGTGVLAAVLARRGVRSIVATDTSTRALGCARDNLDRLGYGEKVELMRTDLYPPGRAPLVVCNPPWIPGKPRTPLDFAIYDPGSRMLRAFLDRLGKHLTVDGEGWLILSDLAERLGLRTHRELLSAFDAAGLRVVDRLDARPRHARARDADDPLFAARSAEITSLWRLSRAT